MVGGQTVFQLLEEVAVHRHASRPQGVVDPGCESLLLELYPLRNVRLAEVSCTISVSFLGPLVVHTSGLTRLGKDGFGELRAPHIGPHVDPTGFLGRASPGAHPSSTPGTLCNDGTTHMFDARRARSSMAL